MSTSEWIKDQGSGRWYYTWVDSYGLTRSTSYDEQELQDINRPRYGTEHEKIHTPAAVNFGSHAQVTDGLGSASRQKKTKSHHASSSKRDYKSRSHGRSQKTSSDHLLSTGLMAETRRNEFTSPDEELAGSSEPFTTDWQPNIASVAGDSLIGDMKKMAMTDVVGAPQYITTARSEGHWDQPSGYAQSFPYNNQSETAATSSTPYYGHGQTTNPWQQNTTKSPTHPYAVNYQNALQGGAHNPAAATLPHQPNDPRHIFGTDGDYELLDNSYKVRTSDYKKFFHRGRVFSTLWTDAVGNTNDDTFMSGVDYVSFGQRVHCKIRRFVVVKQGDRNCICLPVTTYDGRGYKKRGINLTEHGPIYSKGRPPKIKELTKQPLKVNLSKNAIHLHNSYVNYGKAYTVECNVKVKNVGELDESSKKLLRRYFQEVIFSDGSDYLPEGSYPSYDNELADIATGLSGYDTPSSLFQQQYGMPAGDVSATRYYQEKNDDDQEEGKVDLEAGIPPQSSVATKRKSLGDFIRNFFFEKDKKQENEFQGSLSEITQKSPVTPRLKPHVPVDLKYRPNNPSVIEPAGLPIDEAGATIRMQESQPCRSVYQSSPASSADSSPASSVDSLESTTKSLSSMSSILAGINGGERLVTLLLDDQELSSLFEDATRRIRLDKIESNFRRCLIQFADHLKVESTTTKANHVVKLVRRFSRNAAAQIRQELEFGDRFTRNKFNYLKGQEAQEEDQEFDCGGADNDGDDEGNSDDEEKDDLAEFECLIICSNSFSMLKENLRLFIYPDPIHRALFKCWPVTHPRNQQLELTYDFEHCISDFLTNYFPPGQVLGDVMTVTGEAVDAQALSCRDYLKTTWPDFGGLLLNAFESFLRTGQTVREESEYATIDLRHGKDAKNSSRSHIYISLQTTHDLHVKYIDAMMWMTSAVRYSPHSEISYSSASLEVEDSSTTTLISIRQLDLSPINMHSSCWHSLFPHTALVKGYPIRSRVKGRGLEISFADMMLMGRALNFVEYEKGLVVEGLRTLLIPSSELKEDDALQWHFEDRVQHNGSRASRLSKIFRKPGLQQWHKEVLPHELARRRCFLGWVTEGNVVIGTTQYTASIMKSNAACVPCDRSIRSHAITIGTSGLGMVTAQGQMSWTRFSIPSRLTFPIDKDVYDTLADGANRHIIIYDSSTQIGWCLPQASIVLHLLRSILTRRGYELSDAGRTTSLGFCKPSYDGAAEALAILKNCLHVQARKGLRAGVSVEEELSVLVKQLWHMLDFVGDSLDSAIPEYDKAGFKAPEYLHGVEIVDILEMNRCIKTKQYKIQRPWVHLTTYLPVVLFCSGLGQPIVPYDTGAICKTWKSVPHKQNFFTAMGKSIAYILDEEKVLDEEEGTERSRLNEKVQWIHEMRPKILTHCQDKARSIYHTQTLHTVDDCKPNVMIQKFFKDHIKACFIFSNRKPKILCSSPLYCESNASSSKPKTITRMQSTENILELANSDTSTESNDDSDTGLSMMCSSATEEKSPCPESTDESRQSILSGSLPIPKFIDESHHEDRITTPSGLMQNNPEFGHGQPQLEVKRKEKGEAPDQQKHPQPNHHELGQQQSQHSQSLLENKRHFPRYHNRNSIRHTAMGLNETPRQAYQYYQSRAALKKEKVEVVKDEISRPSANTANS